MLNVEFNTGQAVNIDVGGKGRRPKIGESSSDTVTVNGRKNHRQDP
jgi:hypothetical protein